MSEHTAAAFDRQAAAQKIADYIVRAGIDYHALDAVGAWWMIALNADVKLPTPDPDRATLQLVRDIVEGGQHV